MTDEIFQVSSGIAVLLGALGWSFSEYWIHRELGHNPKLIHNPFGREHVVHHSQGNAFAATWKKLVVAVAIAGLLLAPAILVAGARLGSAFVCGYIAFYLYYELLHRLEHVHRGIGPYGRWARAHHFWHHFHNPRANHGVTSSLWDHVFGTCEKPGCVMVPERLAMAWLVNPHTGDVWDDLQGRFALRRLDKRRAA